MAVYPFDEITPSGPRGIKGSSALSAVNYARLKMDVDKAIHAAAQHLLYEPNDAVSRGTIQSMINNYLNDMRQKRAIAQYQTAWDSTNLTFTVKYTPPGSNVDLESSITLNVGGERGPAPVVLEEEDAPDFMDLFEEVMNVLE